MMWLCLNKIIILMFKFFLLKKLFVYGKLGIRNILGDWFVFGIYDVKLMEMGWRYDVKLNKIS